MAQIDVEVLVDTESLASDVNSGSFNSSDVKKYIIMQDNQSDDMYIDEKKDNLFIHAGRGDSLVWNVKAKSGESITFEKFDIEIKSIFKEKGGVPVLDPSGTKFTGTISENAKRNSIVKYTLVMNTKKTKLIHDPYIEIRPRP
jgi:hypothetical protein